MPESIGVQRRLSIACDKKPDIKTLAICKSCYYSIHAIRRRIYCLIGITTTKTIFARAASSQVKRRKLCSIRTGQQHLRITSAKSGVGPLSDRLRATAFSSLCSRFVLDCLALSPLERQQIVKSDGIEREANRGG